MTKVLDWLIHNKEWFLSGIGISIPLALIGWLTSKKSTPEPINLSGSAVNLRAGGDMHVGGSIIVHSELSDATSGRIRQGQLSRFRETIVASAWQWENSMNRATELASSDQDSARLAMDDSATALRTIVSAYKHNKHLFDAACRARIDSLLVEAEQANENSLERLITAIQLINEESERIASAFEQDKSL